MLSRPPAADSFLLLELSDDENDEGDALLLRAGTRTLPLPFTTASLAAARAGAASYFQDKRTRISFCQQLHQTDSDNLALLSPSCRYQPPPGLDDLLH